MVVLDTDHVSLVNRLNSRDGARVAARLDAVPADEVVTTIVTYEEQMRGWMAYIASARSVADEVERYHQLRSHLRFFCDITVLPFDATAAVVFQRLRSLKLRVGTMDLKIASIAMANRATLLTRNLRDFRLVPGLTVEDWSA